MKAIIVTNKGIEDVAALEVEELTKQKPEVKETVLITDVRDKLDICRLCYKQQAANRVLQHLFDFEFKSYEDALKKAEQQIKRIDFSEWLDEKTSFKVLCDRIGDHDFNSPDIAADIGEIIFKSIKDFEPQTDMDLPDRIFFVYIYDNKLYFGLDFAGFDLSKRDYKVMNYTPPIRATNAYALLRIAGYNKGDWLVDPFSASGVVPIEAACYRTGKSINYYRKKDFLFTRFVELKDFFDKEDQINEPRSPMVYCLDKEFRHIKAAKDNSKIAGVNKYINFSRTGLEWLDIKFDESTVDVVLGNGPRFSRGQGSKTYNEFFYQVEFILKKKGKAAVITNKSDPVIKEAEKYNFKLVEERSIWQGQEELKVVVFLNQKREDTD